MSAGRPRVLIVDDEPLNLKVLSEALRDRYALSVAKDGPRALARLAGDELPDLILLDVSMPGMDGFEVCRRVKADPRTAALPVLFISAHTELADKVLAFEVGAVDYVTKPFQFEEVRARVATHLELRRQRQELEGAYERLAGLERLRDDLVHMLVHDLRSPLGAMCASLELLRDDTAALLPPENLGDVDQALASARKMVAMVTTILDVSKLEAGKLQPTLGACELVRLTEEVVGALRALAGARSLVVKPEGAEVTARVDAELVRRVLQNLLANALKFTPARGTIEVRVARRAEAAYLAVTDDGPGIPARDRARIFEKFEQVEARAEGRERASTGLGLTFCKLAVDAHGGRIGVESEEGRGSTFWFELPLGGPSGSADS